MYFKKLNEAFREGSCEDADELPQVMSLESATMEAVKFDNEKKSGGKKWAMPGYLT